MILRIKRDVLASLIESKRDTLPQDQYNYLRRFAETKRASELTPMELFEVSTWLNCLPNDFVSIG